MHVNHSSTRGTAIVVFLVRSYEIQATQNAFRVFVLPRGMLGRARENVNIKTRHGRNRASRTSRHRKLYALLIITAAQCLHASSFIRYLDIPNRISCAEVDHHVYRLALKTYHLQQNKQVNNSLLF